MCEPKLLILNNENYKQFGNGRRRKIRCSAFPLLRPNCTDSSIPLCDFVNKCQAILNIKAQLAKEQRLAKEKRESIACKENPYLPDYHGKEFTSNLEESKFQCCKKKPPKQRVPRNSEFLKSCKHMSPEFAELLNPSKTPITKICPRPQFVTSPRIQDPTDKPNQPIIVNEAYPELAKYILQLINEKGGLNTMYGIDFEGEDGSKRPVQAQPNPYDILTPSVIENLLNKLLSGGSLSQKELEMFQKLLAIIKRLNPHDLAAFFRLLKMRGVVPVAALGKMQIALMKMKPNALSLIKIENFVKNLKHTVIFGDPVEEKKQRERVVAELGKNLKNAIREADEWIDYVTRGKKGAFKVTLKDSKEGFKWGMTKQDETQKIATADVRSITSGKESLPQSSTGKGTTPGQSMDVSGKSITLDGKDAKSGGKSTKIQQEPLKEQGDGESKKSKDDTKQISESKHVHEDALKAEKPSKKDKKRKSKVTEEQKNQESTEKSEAEQEQPQNKQKKKKSISEDGRSSRESSKLRTKDKSPANPSIGFSHVEPEAVNVKAQKMGQEREFRAKLASALSAAQKYADNTLAVDAEDKEELLSSRQSKKSDIVEIPKRKKIYNDCAAVIERYAFPKTGEHMPGYYEPWDIEWPWADLQDHIGYMKMLYLKPVPDPNFSFRHGLEFYQAEMLRPVEPPPPQRKSKISRVSRQLKQ